MPHRLFKSLEDETGQATGFVQKGTLYIALNDDRFEVIQRTISYAQYLGIADATMLQRDQISERWPLLNLAGVTGAGFLASTGQLNPVDATQAFAKGARRFGARIFENTKVKKILVDRGNVRGAESDRGVIEAPIVVLATGMWTRILGESLGVAVPLHAAEHFYFVSESIPGLSPKHHAFFAPMSVHTIKRMPANCW